MTKKEAPIIETGRLLLRRRLEEDIPFMTEMYNQESVQKHLGGYPPRDKHSMLKAMFLHTT